MQDKNVAIKAFSSKFVLIHVLYTVHHILYSARVGPKSQISVVNFHIFLPSHYHTYAKDVYLFLPSDVSLHYIFSINL